MHQKCHTNDRGWDKMISFHNNKKISEKLAYRIQNRAIAGHYDGYLHCGEQKHLKMCIAMVFLPIVVYLLVRLRF